MRIKLVCKVCGKEYSCWPSSHRLFCSRKCYYKNRSDDLIGKRFGHLVAISQSSNSTGGLTRWLCRCDCGNETIAASNNLKRGNTTSCGCYRLEQQRKSVVTHGMTGNPSFERWRRSLRCIADSEWTLEMQQLLFKLQPACVVCGSTDRLNIDHVKPLSKGNGLKPGNAVTLCKSCNSIKHDRDLAQLPPEWRDKIERAAAQFLSAWNSL